MLCITHASLLHTHRKEKSKRKYFLSKNAFHTGSFSCSQKGNFCPRALGEAFLVPARKKGSTEWATLPAWPVQERQALDTRRLFAPTFWHPSLLICSASLLSPQTGNAETLQVWEQPPQSGAAGALQMFNEEALESVLKPNLMGTQIAKEIEREKLPIAGSREPCPFPLPGLLRYFHRARWLRNAGENLFLRAQKLEGSYFLC